MASARSRILTLIDDPRAFGDVRGHDGQVHDPERIWSFGYDRRFGLVYDRDQVPATWGTGTLEGHAVFCVEWASAGYYQLHMDKRDSFAVLLISRSDTGAGNFDIEFDYNHIGWDTGDASGGHSAIAGWTRGDGVHSAELTGSGVSGAFLDGGAHSLTSHSFGDDPFGASDGRYYWQIRNGVQLTVHTAGTGHGTVTSSPAGIDCGATCAKGFNTGTPVTLTATPAAGSGFTGWSGACTGTGACHVTMSAEKTVTATFMLQKKLTVTDAGTGHGTVTSSPAGLSCASATCSKSFNAGTPVILTATPAAGSTFSGWSGACTGKTPCHVTLSSDKSVTATFAIVKETLSVATSGTGHGSVASSPAGLACSSSCSSSFNYGTPVTLTATPAVGSTFTGWSGGCTGTGACHVAMTAARSVTAAFTLETKTLTLKKTGNGKGTVTSDPAGISCAATCTSDMGDYPTGTNVTLTATAHSGSTFTGWSGAGCSGTGKCHVKMSQAATVKANFKLNGAPKAPAVQTALLERGAVARIERIYEAAKK